MYYILLASGMTMYIDIRISGLNYFNCILVHSQANSCIMNQA